MTVHMNFTVYFCTMTINYLSVLSYKSGQSWFDSCLCHRLGDVKQFSVFSISSMARILTLKSKDDIQIIYMKHSNHRKHCVITVVITFVPSWWRHKLCRLMNWFPPFLILVITDSEVDTKCLVWNLGVRGTEWFSQNCPGKPIIIFSIIYLEGNSWNLLAPVCKSWHLLVSITHGMFFLPQ